jgi:hypothetical protein
MRQLSGRGQKRNSKAAVCFRSALIGLWLLKVQGQLHCVVCKGLDMDAIDGCIAQSLRLRPMLCKTERGAADCCEVRCGGLQKSDQRARARRFVLRAALIAS